ncbi:Zinc carboxypeptidase A 1 [Acromyrmex echinatior]|uniref:Zinc carboxypeptidase A 1 n=1 Tax=Acromyrmex echinatior TaxID=103372 RepID=F4WMS9_ACREC|nr:Zinc carboxypeptidase A 1 [Acromyrmex echinatior]
MWRIIVLWTVIMGLSTSDMVSYEGYKVFSVYPSTDRHLELLQLSIKQYGSWFWKEPSKLDGEVQVMIPPNQLQTFYEIMHITKSTFKLQIKNVQKLINHTIPENQSQGFDFQSYHTLEEIYEYLEELAKKYPNKVQVVVGGKTYEGRQIKGVKIINHENNPGIFIEGGIHAKEWISPATAMYILHQLLTSTNVKVKFVADHYNWFIFPIFNPDGYAFTFNKTHGDRLWRKSRKPFSPNCIGANLNRNWDFQWNTSGINNNACSDTYPGNRAFSEIETKTMSEYIKSVKNQLYAYIAFHSYGQLLMTPYGYTNAHIFNYDHLHKISSIGIKALQQKYNTVYKTGCIGEFFTNLPSGLSVDYMAGVLKKSVVYLYNLRDKNEYGFLLPPEQIIPTGEETLDSLVAMFIELYLNNIQDN